MATKTIGQLTQATTINNADEFAIEQSGVTKRVAASVVRGDIVNANIKSDAAIAYSKLNLSNSIVAGDITSAAITPAKLSQPYTLATAQASTSGTSIDFTGIPSWAKRITVTLADVSTSGTNNLIIRLGTSGGFQTTGYTSSIAAISSSPAYTNIFSNVGLIVGGATATSVSQAVATIVNHTGNVWICTGTGQRADGAAFINGYFCGGTTLASTLDRVRVTTVNGTDTFDAGTINISYEG